MVLLSENHLSYISWFNVGIYANYVDGRGTTFVNTAKSRSSPVHQEAGWVVIRISSPS